MKPSPDETPFLSENKSSRGTSFDEDDAIQSLSPRRSWLRRHMTSVVSHSILIFIYTIVTIILISQSSEKNHGPGLVYSELYSSGSQTINF